MNPVGDAYRFVAPVGVVSPTFFFRETDTVHSTFFSQIFFDFQRSISHSISPKFSGKTPYVKILFRAWSYTTTSFGKHTVENWTFLATSVTSKAEVSLGWRCHFDLHLDSGCQSSTDEPCWLRIPIRCTRRRCFPYFFFFGNWYSAFNFLFTNFVWFSKIGFSLGCHT